MGIESEGRSWLRSLIATNPLTWVMVSFLAGFGAGALIMGLL